MSGHRRPLVALVLVSIALLGGCATGERPTLVDTPAQSSDPVAAAVLDRLAIGESATFTASYDITPTMTDQTTQAQVIQSGARQRISVGDVEFFKDDSTSRTCSTGNVDCVDGVDETRVSDLNVTHVFWGTSASQRLSLDAGRSLTALAGRSDTIAGQSATCVDITVPAPEGSGVVVYCAIDGGVLGRYTGADVRIELTSFSPVADESLLL